MDSGRHLRGICAWSCENCNNLAPDSDFLFLECQALAQRAWRSFEGGHPSGHLRTLAPVFPCRILSAHRVGFLPSPTRGDQYRLDITLEFYDIIDIAIVP